MLVVVRLSPVVGPADHDGVVLQTPQAPCLNQMGCPVPEIRGDHHLRKALHPLCLHQFTQRLQEIREEDEVMRRLIHSSEEARRPQRLSRYQSLVLVSHVETCVSGQQLT